MHMTKKVVKLKRKLVKLKNRLVKMKGMIVMIGYIRGYEIRTLSSRKVNKEGYTVLLGEDIREIAVDALNSKGIVYGVYNKQKQCCMTMIFKKQAMYHNGREVMGFMPVEVRVAEGCEILISEFEDIIRRELNEYISWSDTKYYMLAGEITDYETLKAERSSDENNGWFMFFAFLIGLCTKNIGVAFALMICFGCFPFSKRSGKDKKNDRKETAADAT